MAVPSLAPNGQGRPAVGAIEDWLEAGIADLLSVTESPEAEQKSRLPDPEWPPVPGLAYYVGLEDAALALAEAALPGLEYEKPAHIGGREVAHYGPVYDYPTRTLRPPKNELPPALEGLRRVAAAAVAAAESYGHTSTGAPPAELSQCIVNRYRPGEGISAHTDARVFGPHIVCFTFGAPATLVFRRIKGGGVGMYELRPAARSMYVMSGAARSNYTHEMPARLSDMVGDGAAAVRTARGVRYSVTFRSVA